MSEGGILVLKLFLDSSDYIYNFTGKLSKTIVLVEAPELQPLFRPVKGFFKPVRITPPLSGYRSVIPVYELESGKWVLKPVMLRGEYVVEIGADSNTVNLLYNRFKQLEGVKTRLKFENTVVSYVVENISIQTPKLQVDSTITVKTMSPALIPHPLVPTQHVRRFTTNPASLLWIPYMINHGNLSYNQQDVAKAVLELETCFAEHYSTKQKTIFINYDNKREPALQIKAKYIILTKEKKCEEIAFKTLQTARIYGIGASRANGFGSITIETPRNNA
ncbi:MAG: hypothetical protein QXN57_04175 [Desulfurococcaceae archaeon]